MTATSKRWLHPFVWRCGVTLLMCVGSVASFGCSGSGGGRVDGGVTRPDGGEGTPDDGGPSAPDGGAPDGGAPDGGAPDGGASLPDCERVVPTSPPTALGLNPFYKKYVDIGGLPLVSSDKVTDAAFRVACDILSNMVSMRPDVAAKVIANGVRVGIMATTEVTTDMPEHSDLNEAFPGTDWDTRARGLGATLARPLTSVGEENLLKLATDPYLGESILVHEFAHTFFTLGVKYLPEGAERQMELSAAYAAAIAAGTFANTYAETNEQEYWAEGVQSWFNTNLEASPANGIHNEINSREELRAADEKLSTLIARFFADDTWTP